MNDSPDLPLDGVRVIDFSTLLPGPLATLLLVRAGAEVIKVEPPAGDAMRSLLGDDGAAFDLLNAGKRSVCVDLKAADGREAVGALCAGADVVVEQFRPGVMARLGLDYQALARDNPSLVYCAITGYGQHGPGRGAAGHDINYIAEAGLFDLFRDRDGAPKVPPVLLADVVGGAYPAFANILLALVARARSGRGGFIDIAMTRGLQALSVSSVAAALDPSRRRGSSALDGSAANYRCYRCADGAWLAVGALEAKFWSRLADLLELPAALRELPASAPELVEAAAGRFASRPAAHWLARFEGEDVCCSRVLGLVEALERIAEPGQGSFPLPLPLAPELDGGASGTVPALGEGNAELLGRSFAP